MLTIRRISKERPTGNELNPDRTAALRKQGFSETTSYDAAEKWDKAMEASASARVTMP